MNAGLVGGDRFPPERWHLQGCSDRMGQKEPGVAATDHSRMIRDVLARSSDRARAKRALSNLARRPRLVVDRRRVSAVHCQRDRLTAERGPATRQVVSSCGIQSLNAKAENRL